MYEQAVRKENLSELFAEQKREAYPEQQRLKSDRLYHAALKFGLVKLRKKSSTKCPSSMALNG
jgi:hypothetical protein